MIWTGISNVQESTSNVIFRKLSNNKCDITIQTRISAIGDNRDSWIIFPMKQICTACGISALSFPPGASPIKVLNRLLDLEKMGFCTGGVCLNESGGISRYFNYSTESGFAPLSLGSLSDAGIITGNDIIEIQIYGATYA